MDSLIHSLRDITIRRISVSEMNNNVYLLTAKASGAQLLIDAADDLPAIQAMLAESVADAASPPKLALIATTHQHWDHVRALPGLVEATGAKTSAGVDDADALPVPVDVQLRHGDVGNFDGFDITAVHLRGHTPGSIAYVYLDPEGPAHIFSGDSLFPGGVGNTQNDAARFTSLLNDVSERLFEAYPDDTVVHPGHGDPTTLGAERPHLAEWRERGW
ncbi:MULTISPECIES: MBL fold metallo-hydrolase [Arthrobacter]|uniref:Glyoxylase-like metal-dependent hydrolase (Beta-lactamase superfamily II) n=1 Tax=Arthrobacter bambusae TaxID=1338426 RepID=A0AAW8DID9_9MICC|nr:MULTISPECIES: MBL fold metallo-hydrolase [Arthrobacter]MDP9905847.1 glyoxylase-like metal-dependent hydrolase (beta-lactamase superfamily II) [Arthrobacter bambusae]MDQ0130434.1 glyoxylase-like metal-dependent hydrolase (beta-lactamase superfamily II) [Arthrobacter bambusae]MDQ0181645.1 glyoxylase-like metal-dependent hydrolase (beta-lactamase superfamily II) [Arthrobacter bambusae]